MPCLVAQQPSHAADVGLLLLLCLMHAPFWLVCIMHTTLQLHSLDSDMWGFVGFHHASRPVQAGLYHPMCDAMWILYLKLAFLFDTYDTLHPACLADIHLAI
jgi:hypothetical protein